ncbi:MAG: glycoside hydrolase family 16 protein [Bacteroidaceae bacterium]
MKKKECYALVFCLLAGVLQASDLKAAKRLRLTTADYCKYEGNCNGAAGRSLSSLTMTTDNDDVLTLSDIQAAGGKSPVYYDCTNKVILAEAGATVTPSAKWNGGWMHGYLFIDYNNDGTFAQKMSNNTYPSVGDEVVSFSYFNGVNSLGKPTEEGAGVSPSAMPSFTLPATLAAGDYRVRFKIDWDSVDPCGSPDIAKHVGSMVDFTLRVGTLPVRRYGVNADNKESDYELVWRDEFDGTSFDEKTWTRIIPEVPPSDWCRYMSTHSALFGMDNGELILRGMNNTFDKKDSRPYLCGGVYSMDKKAFKSGRVEIRAKYTSGRGVWPAIWMLPEEKGGWPLLGEIDIMEHLNYENVVYQTAHNKYTIDNVNGGGNTPQKSTTVSINKEVWNTYAVELLPDTLKFFVNNQQTFFYPRSGAENQFPYDRAFFLLMDMQLGGSWVGNVDASTLPVEMRIDYVRHFKKHYIGGLISITDQYGKKVKLGSKLAVGTTLCAKVTPEEGFELNAFYLNGVDITAQYDAVKGYVFKVSEPVRFSADYEVSSIHSTVKEESTERFVSVQNQALLVKTMQPEEVYIYTTEGKMIAKSSINGSRLFRVMPGSYVVKKGQQTQTVTVN